jgi:hypothetical protein
MMQLEKRPSRLAFDTGCLLQRSSATLQRRPKRQEPKKTEKKRKKAPIKLKDVPAVGECTETIGFEGSCAFLAKNTPSCCDPDNGISVPGKKKNSNGESCPSEKWTPAFACDNNCRTAIATGCNAGDRYLAIPSTIPNRRGHCGDSYTVCANGKNTTAVVRDTADKKTNPDHFEASPQVFTDLGALANRSFAGKVYGPDTDAAVIAADTCCSPAAPAAAPAGGQK